MTAGRPAEHAGAQPPASESRLLAADSFRVRDHAGVAEARGFALHLARFRRSALAAAAETGGHADFASELDGFLSTAVGRIAAAGAGFPRLELRHDSSAQQPGAALTFTLLLRPLPGLTDEIALRTAHGVPPLPHPERKGPGIAAYNALRSELGAEPLLIDAAGHAIEGGTVSLLWWVGDEAYYASSDARVDSVTERLVRGSLESLGVRVSADTATPAELASTEVWALNALHGIRRVASIDGRPGAARQDARLHLARRSLDASFAPINRESTLCE